MSSRKRPSCCLYFSAVPSTSTAMATDGFLPVPWNGAAHTRIGTSPSGSGLFNAAMSAGDVPALASASRFLAIAFGSGGM